MELAVRVGKVDGRYRGRVELGGVSVYTTAGTHASRGEARDAAVRMLAAGLAELMAAHDPDAHGDGA